MTHLTISTWNINQRSGLGENIPDMVFNAISQLNSDIIVLTEYLKSNNHFEFCEKLKLLDYNLYLYSHTEKNQNEIMIGVKSKFVKRPLLHTLPQDKLSPDFLHLQIDYENTPLHIVGARVKILPIRSDLSYERKLPLLIKDAKDRLLQVNRITKYLQKLNGKILLIGDFNNFHYFENNTIDSWYHDKEFLQNYYSYPILVAKMTEVNLTAYSPTGNYDEVYSWINPNPKIGVDNMKRYIRNDHLFSNITEISNIQYNWKFTEQPNYVNKVGYPDHAILTATVKF